MINAQKWCMDHDHYFQRNTHLVCHCVLPESSCKRHLEIHVLIWAHIVGFVMVTAWRIENRRLVLKGHFRHSHLSFLFHHFWVVWQYFFTRNRRQREFQYSIGIVVWGPSKRWFLYQEHDLNILSKLDFWQLFYKTIYTSSLFKHVSSIWLFLCSFCFHKLL